MISNRIASHRKELDLNNSFRNADRTLANGTSYISFRRENTLRLAFRALQTELKKNGEGTPLLIGNQKTVATTYRLRNLFYLCSSLF